MKRRGSLLLSLYAAATGVAEPAKHFLLSHRLKAGKEDKIRLKERSGIASLPRPEGRLFWLHGASVGEFLSILPLIERMVARGLRVLVTTGTLTSAAIAAERLPEGALHQFVPFDFPASIRRFYAHWQPDMAIFVESEIWPNLMRGAQKRKIPLAVVNARMSVRSFRRWQPMRRMISPVLARMDMCLAQSEVDAARFRDLGAAQAKSIGNLKFDAPPLPCDEMVLAELREAIGKRPVWLAASTHDGEEAIIIEAHKALLAKHPQLLTILVPRHPKRGAEILALATADGLKAARRKTDMVPKQDIDFYIADTLGELGLFYRACPVALIGASLVAPGGGHNPIEAAQLGTAILHGPHPRNFTEIYAAFQAGDGTIEVADCEALVAALDQLLKDPERKEKLAANARLTLATMSGALDRTLDWLEPYLSVPAPGNTLAMGRN